MRNRKFLRSLFGFGAVGLGSVFGAMIPFLPLVSQEDWRIESSGGYNRVIFTTLDGERLALEPDFRRDGVVEIWGQPKNSSAESEDSLPLDRYVIGKAELPFLVTPREAFWDSFVASGRFHETTPVSHIPLDNVLTNRQSALGGTEGDVIQGRDGTTLRLLDTPGFTRSSVSYVIDEDVSGVRSLVCGNLIYGDGKLIDLYDLQDSFDGTSLGGYHGYMARAVKLIGSLKKIRNENADRLIPVRGPIITEPHVAIDRLIDRLHRLYLNYLKTCALWWYFGDETMTQSARQMLEDDSLMPENIERMTPGAVHELPSWLMAFATTRVILSESGAAFVLDCNGPKEFHRLIGYGADGMFQTVEGVFITHYHNDHVGGLPLIVERFGCPIYGSETQRPILERPADYRMPCVADVALKITPVAIAERMKWHEFDFTFYHFPGQTLYHDALLVAKENEPPILFVGDSFTPTGLDDYCLWNRNLPGDNEGFLFCLAMIRSMTPRPWLVNQHIKEPFSFRDAQLETMIETLKQRRTILAELFPYCGVGFGVDSAWARIEPYCLDISDAEKTSSRLVIRNHDDRPRTFTIQTTDPNSRVQPICDRIEIAPHAEGFVELAVDDSPLTRDYEIVSLLVRSVEEETLAMSVEMILRR